MREFSRAPLRSSRALPGSIPGGSNWQSKHWARGGNTGSPALTHGYALGLKRGLALLAAFGVACTLGGAEARGRAAAVGKPVEVVVELKQPSLAVAMGMRAHRSPGYLRGLEADQAQVQQRHPAEIPAAEVRWRFRYVLYALAVVVPPGQAGRLAALPEVARAYQSVEYQPLLDQSVPLI